MSGQGADRARRRKAGDVRAAGHRCQPRQRLEWLGTLGDSGLFDGRHSFTLTPVGHGHTRLVQAEVLSGDLVPLAGSVLAKTEAGFEAMNAALLARLEKDQTGSKGVPAH